MRNLCGNCKHRFECRYAKLGIKVVKCENYNPIDLTLDKWLRGDLGECLNKQKKRLKNSILGATELH